MIFNFWSNSLDRKLGPNVCKSGIHNNFIITGDVAFLDFVSQRVNISIAILNVL